MTHAKGGQRPDRSQSAGVAPVAEFLLRRARQEAERIRARAAADSGIVLARAREDAAAILADARAAGTAEATAFAAADLTRARRRARAIVLGAQREAYEELRRRVRTAACALREDPVLMDRLRALALETAGPGARVTEHPEGGVVAIGAGTWVDCSLPALADRAVDALGAMSEKAGRPICEVERLWVP